MLRAPKTPHDILYRMLGTRQNSPRPLRGAACGTKHGKAQKQLRGQGGNVAGLVLWAPVAAWRDGVRTSGPNLVPPRSMWNKCFGRRKLTTICCTGCWGLAKTPRGRSAALSGELGGRGTFRGTARKSVATPPVPAQCVRRPGRGGRRNGYFKRLAWSKVGLLKTSAQN